MEAGVLSGPNISEQRKSVAALFISRGHTKVHSGQICPNVSK